MNDALDLPMLVVSTTAPRWQALVETVPEELLERSPAAHEWSAADCLRHVLTVERLVIPLRVRHILAGREELVPFDPDAPGETGPERAPGELLAAFLALRRDNEEMLASLEPADLELSSHHPEFGRVTLRELLNTWAAHDLQHLVQAEEALMQAFIPGAGPWRNQFADHDVAVDQNTTKT